MHIPGIELEVGGSKAESSVLKLTLYTSQRGGWNKAMIVDCQTNQGFVWRSFEVHKHCVVVADQKCEVFIQFKRPPSLKRDTDPPLPSTSLNMPLQIDRYRNIKIKGGVNLQAQWDVWAKMWGLPAPVSDSTPNIRAVFRTQDRYDSQDGAATLKDLMHAEASKKADRQKSGFVELDSATWESVKDSLLSVEHSWISGEGSPLLHCVFCQKAVVLLDMRPEHPVPRWCCITTGEPHETCTEMRLWAGKAGLDKLDDDSESENDLSADEDGSFSETQGFES